MKGSLWVGAGVLVGIWLGYVLKVALNKKEEEKEPVLFKRFDQKGDFALRDTERILSRTEF